MTTPIKREDFYPRNRWTVDQQGSRYQLDDQGDKLRQKNGNYIHTYDKNDTNNQGPLMFVIDESTNDAAQEFAKLPETAKLVATKFSIPNLGRRYLNEFTSWLWVKSSALTLATPLVHGLAMTIITLIRLAKILLFVGYALAAVCGNKEAKKYVSQHAQKRAIDAGLVLLSPLGLLGLMFSSLYGMLCPLLATITSPISHLWTPDSLDKRIHDMLCDSRKLYATFERRFYGWSVLAPCFQPLTYRCKPIVPNVFVGFKNHLFGGKLETQNAM